MRPSSTLYLVMMSFPADRADVSNRRFDYEHVPDLLSCPGFLGIERFARSTVQATGWEGAPAGTDYMNFWELAEPEALLTEAYRLRSQGPDASWKGHTPHFHWRQQQSDEQKAARQAAPGGAPAGSGQPRTVWARRPSPWGNPSITVTGPRAVLVSLYDLDAAADAEVNAYLDAEEVPETLACPGVLSCERYASTTVPEVAPEVGGAKRYIDIYDLMSAEVASSPEYAQQRTTPSDRGREMRRHMTILAHGVYTQRPSPWTANFATAGQGAMS
jgi:hypothetical protein